MECPKCRHENPEDSKFCKECGTKFDADVEHTRTLETPTEKLTRGSVFAGRYEIIEELGKGGMGKVYRVEDTKVKEEIALKLIKPEIAADKKTIERFRNELKIARKIRHKNVCAMFDLSEEKGSHFITMEYVSGGDLKKFIRRSGQMGVGKAISIAKQICEGLSEAHSLGIVHRDLKSNNIMIDDNGNARIMDFGIARTVKEKGITGSGVMIGTPEYMSPEQAEAKDVDQRSDIYSLGIIMYEMVTGYLPFEGETPLALAMKHKGESPKDPKEFNPQISDNISRVILKCMEKVEENRYQSAEEIRTELEKIEQGLPTTDRVVPRQKTLTSREITVQFSMKKILIPVLAVIAFIVIGLIIWSPWTQREMPTSSSERPSIAVLPFKDLSPDQDQEHICAGLAESIINALSQIDDLLVIAPESSFLFKGKETNFKEIREALSVKTLLSGTLQRAGNRLLVTARLINVSDESVLSSNQYPGNLENFIDIQSEISLAIVDALKIELVGGMREKIVKHYSLDPEAHDLYLKARNYYQNNLTLDSQYQAIEYFKKAIEKDPGFAYAYSGIARCYDRIGSLSYGPPHETFPKVKEYAVKALEIDNTLAEAHTLLADVMGYYEWDWTAAEQAYIKAIELNPNYTLAHRWYSLLLIFLGRGDEAIERYKKVREFSPLNFSNEDLAFRNLLLGRYDQALDYALKSNELSEVYSEPRLHLTLGLVYLYKGRVEETISELQKAVTSSEIPFFLSSLGYAYGILGKKREAIEVLEQLTEKSKKRYISPACFAFVHIGLGDKDEAFKYLAEAYEERDSLLLYIKKGIWFDPLRSDPRFKELLKKMNLEE